MIMHQLQHKYALLNVGCAENEPRISNRKKCRWCTNFEPEHNTCSLSHGLTNEERNYVNDKNFARHEKNMRSLKVSFASNFSTTYSIPSFFSVPESYDLELYKNKENFSMMAY